MTIVLHLFAAAATVVVMHWRCDRADLQSPRFSYPADQFPHQCADWRGAIEIDPIHHGSPKP